MLEGDAQTFASWELDETFCFEAGWEPHATLEEASAWWKWRFLHPKADTVRLVGVHERTVIGYADLYGSSSAERELGFAVGPSAAWGRGLGAALTHASASFAFEALELDRISARTTSDATASIKILIGLGMHPVNHVAETEATEPRQHLRFAVSREAWLTKAH